MTGGYGRLDRETIIDAALRIAARPGTPEIKVRELGQELGADPTAVYRHFRNKQDVVSAAIDQLMGGIGSALPPDLEGTDLLATVADGLLETFTRYPAIGRHLADVRPVGPAELQLVDRILATLQRMGLSDDALVRHYAALSGFSIAYLAGACRELISAGSTSTSGAGDIAWLPEAGDSPALPSLARYAQRIAALDYRSTYDTTIQVLLDAVKAEGNRWTLGDSNP